MGAFLWFAWMYATANIALEFAPAPGVAQAAINWWYVGALVQLWLTPVALGDRVLFDSRYQSDARFTATNSRSWVSGAWLCLAAGPE